MSDEKRRDPRYNSKHQLWCEGQDKSLAGETRNISSSGMFILTDSEAEIGSELKISFDDEGGGHVEVNMEVVWRGEQADESGKQGLGLRILGFDQGADVYERFVQRLAEDKTEGDDGDEREG